MKDATVSARMEWGVKNLCMYCRIDEHAGTVFVLQAPPVKNPGSIEVLISCTGLTVRQFLNPCT